MLTTKPSEKVNNPEKERIDSPIIENPPRIASETEEEIQIDTTAPLYEPDKYKPLKPQKDLLQKFEDLRNSYKSKFQKPLTEEEKIAATERANLFGDMKGNETTELPREPLQLFTPPDISKEALLTDVAFRTIVNDVEKVSEKLNIEVQKSDELANDWNELLTKLDAYIKTIKLKRFLKYSACAITLVAFLWKMGALRAIPNFASSMISIIPSSLSTTTASVVKEVKEVPKPGLEATVKTLLETPVTPLTLITCVGGLTLGMAAVKAILWVLPKTPK